jgi:hypothetical protein
METRMEKMMEWKTKPFMVSQLDNVSLPCNGNKDGKNDGMENKTFMVSQLDNVSCP